jgi:hypothetical protein
MSNHHAYYLDKTNTLSPDEYREQYDLGYAAMKAGVDRTSGLPRGDLRDMTMALAWRNGWWVAWKETQPVVREMPSKDFENIAVLYREAAQGFRYLGLYAEPALGGEQSNNAIHLADMGASLKRLSEQQLADGDKALAKSTGDMAEILLAFRNWPKEPGDESFWDKCDPAADEASKIAGQYEFLAVQAAQREQEV